MPDSLRDFHVSAGDWRQSLRRNRSRTRFVIVTFILIYLCIGVLVDLYIQSGHYPQASLAQVFVALMTFKLFPTATLILGFIAVISLWVTFAFHDKMILLGTEYVEVTPETARNLKEKQLYNVIEEMKVAAGLQYMPRVFIIEADYMNAFASGYSEKSALVAITRGLMEKLDRDELTAVMAHELSHIRHMDIKLTLMASVLANITLMMVDILFYSALFSSSGEGHGEGRSSRNHLFWIILFIRYLLPIVTVLLMLYLSRTREYMADAGCVELMRNNEPLARALTKIQSDHEQHHDQYAAAYQSTPHEAVRREAYIFDPVKQGVTGTNSPTDMFSTHPGILKRLAAIGIKRKR
ncbi:MAG: zinc metalloprotease HtpX [Coxiella sp. RIFCSPHIGHO2_12_FULL_42_15]|nr:MAG: zinc metalloprotease HtpX [Coxiella sp. RIFCSPHIGHO2_12_FULL_42_15]